MPDVTFTFTGVAPFDFTFTDGVTPTTILGHGSATYTVSGATAGIYSVTSLSDANSCDATSLGTPVNVTVNPQPTSTAGALPLTICASETTDLSSSAATGLSLLWSTSSNGTFDDSTLLAATYTPGSMDVANSPVTLTLTATSAGCVTASSNVIITVTGGPFADAAAVATMICGNGTVDLALSDTTGANSLMWTKSGDGTFDNASSLTPIYTPGGGDIASGTVTLTLTANDLTACPAAVDSEIITINQLPVATALAAATSICAGDMADLVGSSISGGATTNNWSSSGDGTFNDSTILEPLYSPGPVDITNGTVDLTITTDAPPGCTAAGSTITITIDPSPVASAGVDQAVCAGDLLSLTGTIGGSASTSTWGSSGTGTFGSLTNLNTLYTPSASDITAGTVTITLITDDPVGNCTAAQDDMLLTISALPIADAGNQR